MRNASAVAMELREVVLCVPAEEEVRRRERSRNGMRETRVIHRFSGAIATMRNVNASYLQAVSCHNWLTTFAVQSDYADYTKLALRCLK